MSLESILLGLDNWEYLTIYGPKFLVTVLLSLFCGMLLGYEREKKEKPAGLRTLTLITMGSTIFVLSSKFLSGDIFDPARVAAQVVTGVGFIGGGAIYRSDGFVQGVTTAATIWVAAAIGILLGADHHVLGVLFTLITYSVLVTIPYIEDRLTMNNNYEVTKIYLSPEGKKKGWFYLRELFERNNVSVEVGPKKEYLIVKYSKTHAANKQPLIETSQSYFVERLETLDDSESKTKSLKQKS